MSLTEYLKLYITGSKEDNTMRVNGNYCEMLQTKLLLQIAVVGDTGQMIFTALNVFIVWCASMWLVCATFSVTVAENVTVAEVMYAEKEYG